MWLAAGVGAPARTHTDGGHAGTSSEAYCIDPERGMGERGDWHVMGPAHMNSYASGSRHNSISSHFSLMWRCCRELIRTIANALREREKGEKDRVGSGGGGHGCSGCGGVGG